MTDLRLIRRWWSHRGQYEWITGYLASRQLQRFTQLMTATITIALAVIPVAMLFSPRGAGGLIGQTTVVFVACSCLTMGTLWVIRWPTEAQSVAFAVVANLCISAVCIAEHDRLSAILASVSFAITGGYVALWHTARVMVFNSCIAVATAVFLAVQLTVQSGDAVLAVSKLLLVFMTVLAIPLAVQTLIQHLGADAFESDIDPLSGLLNRRAFYRAVERLLESRYEAGDRYLLLAMFDLDNFKLVNDTNGHAYGDQALVSVGEALCKNSRSSAVIARVGGEEFFVAETHRTEHQTDVEILRSAIAAVPFDLTASVGVATIELTAIPVSGRQDVINHLIGRADAAMYRAKRAGGNQCHYAR